VASSGLSVLQSSTSRQSFRRLPQAKLTGQADPGPPAKASTERVRTYKTKGETADKKGVTGPIVLTLLFIAVVVPMLQYWGAFIRIKNCKREQEGRDPTGLIVPTPLFIAVAVPMLQYWGVPIRWLVHAHRMAPPLRLC